MSSEEIMQIVNAVTPAAIAIIKEYGSTFSFTNIPYSIFSSVSLKLL